MCERTPEIDDVWEVNGTKYHILFVSKNAVRVVAFTICQHAKILVFDKKYFMSCFKYLGKSKANIKQLFEVSNDK